MDNETNALNVVLEDILYQHICFIKKQSINDQFSSEFYKRKQEEKELTFSGS